MRIQGLRQNEEQVSRAMQHLEHCLERGEEMQAVGLRGRATPHVEPQPEEGEHSKKRGLGRSILLLYIYYKSWVLQHTTWG